MKILTVLQICAILIFSVLFTSCSTNTTQPNNMQGSYTMLGTAIASGTIIELYSEDSLLTGYNTLFIKAIDANSKAVIRDAHITIIPSMDMGMMQHSCPVEQPVSSIITGDYFHFATVFQMPTSNSGSWKVKVEFHNHITNKEDVVEIPVKVGESNCCKPIKCTDNNTYIIAIANHMDMITGLNDIEFTVHRKIDGMTYEPATNIKIDVVPDMPSMGHGSPNNVNPIHVSNGHFKGKVNFTMNGEWRIKANLLIGDTNIGGTELMLMIKK